jgi:ABC-type uncharacterized transport system permease subunit
MTFWILTGSLLAFLVYLAWVAFQDSRRGVAFSLGDFLELYFLMVPWVLAAVFVVLVLFQGSGAVDNGATLGL